MKKCFGMVAGGGVLLAGCGKNRVAGGDGLRQRYREMQAAHMEAEITCHLETENRTFTVSCDWTPTGAGTTVTAPEALAGLTASVSGEDLTVSYDGRLCPPEACGTWPRPTACRGCCTPWRRAIWRRRAGRPWMGPTACVWLLDTTAAGGKVLCTVWLGGDGARCMPSFLRTAAWC